ncbi:uncharacterized protein LOC121855613 [Homarus americanus]|uniref:uncharacterized protein LOC121855613 n=1 Tax=Homarus americanus TaxID=6706 RepID=UPI001C47A795|nr:uncharacterized protein LOC121855613 [Homarus americanus]
MKIQVMFLLAVLGSVAADTKILLPYSFPVLGSPTTYTSYPAAAATYPAAAATFSTYPAAAATYPAAAATFSTYPVAAANYPAAATTYIHSTARATVPFVQNAAPVLQYSVPAAVPSIAAVSVYSQPRTAIVSSPAIIVNQELDDDDLVATPYGILHENDDDDDDLVATPYGILHENDDDDLIATPYGILREIDDDDDLVATPYGLVDVSHLEVDDIDDDKK